MAQQHELIQKTQLPNGLLILTEAMPGVESVSLGIWADAGSCDEGPGEFGLAHFLEHMLFKGTTTRSAFDLAEAIEDVGGQLNAYTERETTHLFARVLAEHLPLAMELLADMTCHSTFPQEEFDRERQVIIEEIRRYDSQPEERIHDLIMEGLWQGGALGHPILGTEASVAGLTTASIQSCWQRHFAANRVLITATGKLEHAAIVAMAETLFADLPQSAGVYPRLPEGGRVPNIIEVEEEEQVHFCWAGKSFPARDERNFALAMIDAVLGGSTTSRLFQEVREKRGLAYDVASYTMGFRETGMICATGATSPETFPEVLRLVREELEKLRHDGLTGKELARAKEQMKAGMALSLESTVERMRMLATHQFTWGEIYPLGYLIERLNQVSLDDIRQVMDEVIDIRNWTFTAIGPVNADDILPLIR